MALLLASRALMEHMMLPLISTVLTAPQALMRGLLLRHVVSVFQVIIRLVVASIHANPVRKDLFRHGIAPPVPTARPVSTRLTQYTALNVRLATILAERQVHVLHVQAVISKAGPETGPVSYAAQ